MKHEEGLNFPEDIKVHRIPDRYPSGAERLIIKEILNKQLTRDQIPAAGGILVLNVQTVYSIYKAIYLNTPADTRFITVANQVDGTAKVVKVRLGMRVHQVLESVYPGMHQCFVGGGIMQAHLAGEEDVIDPAVNFIATGPFPRYKESPQCSQCGNCSRNCPAGLQVNQIADLVDRNKLSEAASWKTEKCMGCGSCSYSCLAGRNLAAKVKAVNNYITNKKNSV